jgi:hypothetical protein
MQKIESSLRLTQDVFNTAAQIWRLVVLGLGLLVFADSAHSTDRFVRSSSQGLANGTSWANAWSVANLNANWASVQPGDTIWLAGGNYSGGINFNKSGSAGNYIYVKRATAGDPAVTGSAGWSPSFDSQVVFGPSGSTPLNWSGTSGVGSYVYVDGRTTNGISCRYDNSANAFLGAAAWTGGGQNNIVLTNLDLAGPGGASPFFYNGDNSPLNMRSPSPISYITITHCSVHGGPNLLRSHPNGGNHHILIEYCRFYDNASSNTDVHANLFYNEQGRDWTIRYNDFSGWQVEGIVLWDVRSGIYHIYGNVFHDPIQGVASGFWPGSNASGNDPQGTVYLYNNTFVGVSITTPQSRSWQFGPGSVARNNIYWNSSWAANSTIADSDYNFSSGSTPGANSIGSGSNPFVNEAANDFRIAATIGAKFPRDKGIALPAPFNTTADGSSRGSDGAFDIGAFEYGAGGPATNPVISVTPGSLDFGTIASGATKDLAFTVRNAGGGLLAGMATVSSPFTVISGSSYSLSSNQSQTVTIRYNPAAAGSHLQSATFTGGGGATAVVSGSAFAMLPGLSFESYAGTISAPFVTNSGGYISQPGETSVTEGGQAVYGFTISAAGAYTISVSVNAPNESANSLFVNIDAQPTDPAMIWDIPVTTGFANQNISWRGNGAFDSPQYVPAVFNLTAGTHQLILRGREGGVQLGRITVAPAGGIPNPPQNLRVTAAAQ